MSIIFCNKDKSWTFTEPSGSGVGFPCNHGAISALKNSVSFNESTLTIWSTTIIKSSISINPSLFTSPNHETLFSAITVNKSREGVMLSAIPSKVLPSTSVILNVDFTLSCNAGKLATV